MGLIFDARSARLYETWYSSPAGQAMEKLVEGSMPLLMDPQPGEKILDIGCGEGNHLLMFHRLGLDVYGIDASSYMIRRAKKRLDERATVTVGVATDIPFEDNEFDLAVMINTLEFLDEPLEALREAGRVAKRKVFIGVMNNLSWYCLWSKFLGLFRESLFNHVTLYSLWGLNSYVRSAFGEAPITWRCGQIEGPMMRKLRRVVPDRRYFEHCPMGFFLGIAVDVRYWVRTEQHALKVGLGKAGQPVVRGVTMEKLRSMEGEPQDERSLFV